MSNPVYAFDLQEMSQSLGYVNPNPIEGHPLVNLLTRNRMMIDEKKRSVYYKVIDVAGDGYCGYYACGLILRLLVNGSYTDQDLNTRDKIVNLVTIAKRNCIPEVFLSMYERREMNMDKLDEVVNESVIQARDRSFVLPRIAVKSILADVPNHQLESVEFGLLMKMHRLNACVIYPNTFCNWTIVCNNYDSGNDFWVLAVGTSSKMSHYTLLTRYFDARNVYQLAFSSSEVEEIYRKTGQHDEFLEIIGNRVDSCFYFEQLYDDHVLLVSQ